MAASTATRGDDVCRALNDRYHCYALDLRGHGDSEWSPTLDYGLDAVVRDVASFIDRLALRTPVIVGHSLGGFAAMQYATEEHTELAGLVVVDASPLAHMEEAVARIRDFVLSAKNFASLDEAVDHVLAHSRQRDREQLRERLTTAMRQLPNGRWTWKRDQRHLTPDYFTTVRTEARRLAERVHTIRCPTLIVRGADSDALSSEEARTLASLIGRATLVEVAGAGHNIHRDNSDGLVAALRPFLDDCVPPVSHDVWA